MKQKKFWLVWRDNNDGTVYNNQSTKKHLSYESACAEAKRLAAKHPNIFFYILKTSACLVGQPKIYRIGLEK